MNQLDAVSNQLRSVEDKLRAYAFASGAVTLTHVNFAIQLSV